MSSINIKRKLFALCEVYVNEKINTAQEAIDNAQTSANEENKSSSGDKYETGRSMMQLEIEKYSAQLAEAIKLRKGLVQINVEKVSQTVQLGSLVITNNGKYFISISAGKLLVDKTEYMAISFFSPIGQVLIGKKENDQFEFRGKNFQIKSII